MTSQEPLPPQSPCPCGSANNYEDCCQAIIGGAKAAPNAEALMRSRYSAHVVVDVDYLLSSWKIDPTEALSRQEIENWAKGSQWLGLTIHRCSKGGKDDTEGWVEFSARFVAESDEKPSFHREYSHFVKEDGHWFYLDAVPGKTSRNEACPCGSGKKYKHCCHL